MKTLKPTQLFLGLLVTICISCDRERGFGDAAEVTEEEALEMVQTSLVSEAYGMNIQADDASALDSNESSKSVVDCGVINARTMERNSLPNATVKFTHDIDYRFSLVCENDVPKAYAIDFIGNGTYNSPRMESDDTITYNAVLANIASSEGPYIYNSSFIREGTQTTKIAGRTKNFDSTLSIENSNIAVDKNSRVILEGSSTFSLTGTLSTGEPFSYKGTVSFKGNGEATIVINGNTYNVQI